MKCLDCLTLEVMPDWLGPKDEERYDPLLNGLVARHVGPLNREQLSRRAKMAPGSPRVREIREGEEHLGQLFQIAPDDWANPEAQKEVVRQIWHDHVGYPDEFYATRDTYAEDAVICYRRHNRPGSETGPHSCGDYHDDSKRLTDTAWKARGLRAGIKRDHVYLCNWCPYQSVVTTRIRSKRGDYDK